VKQHATAEAQFAFLRFISRTVSTTCTPSTPNSLVDTRHNGISKTELAREKPPSNSPGGFLYFQKGKVNPVITINLQSPSTARIDSLSQSGRSAGSTQQQIDETNLTRLNRINTVRTPGFAGTQEPKVLFSRLVG